MRAIDFSPLFRSSIGFDRFDRLFDTAFTANEAGNNYPPYNIERRGEDQYRLIVAVAGFLPQDLEVTLDKGVLYVKGSHGNGSEDVTYLHRGIAGRAFERRFELADHIQVERASLENGLLVVDLKREIPEALKPRRIEIAGENAGPTAIESDAA